MTATQIITILTILEALTPTVSLLAQGVKDLTGKDIDAENLTLAELLALKEQLQLTSPDLWPDLKFKTPGN